MDSIVCRLNVVFLEMKTVKVVFFLIKVFYRTCLVNPIGIYNSGYSQMTSSKLYIVSTPSFGVTSLMKGPFHAKEKILISINVSTLKDKKRSESQDRFRDERYPEQWNVQIQYLLSEVSC